VIYQNEVIEGREIQLDGNEFRHCTIRNCVIYFAASGPTSFPGTSFSHSTFRFTGAAEATLELMQRLYTGDGKRTVEQIFAAVRANAVRSAPASFAFRDDVPSVLYKYFRAEYAELALKGQFRVGTLHDFRRDEDHGSEIGDAGEGTKVVFQDLQGASKDILQGPNVLNQFFKVPEGANIFFSGITLQVNHDTPDLFIFCVSSVYDERAMREFGYDTCIEIVRPRAFFEALHRALRDQLLVNQGVLARCQYAERRRDVATDGEFPAALLKAKKHEYQQEVRALWQPRAQRIEPTTIVSTTAAQHIRLRLPDRT
jgi:hypothetical protein